MEPNLTDFNTTPKSPLQNENKRYANASKFN